MVEGKWKCLRLWNRADNLSFWLSCYSAPREQFETLSQLFRVSFASTLQFATLSRLFHISFATLLYLLSNFFTSPSQFLRTSFETPWQLCNSTTFVSPLQLFPLATSYDFSMRLIFFTTVYGIIFRMCQNTNWLCRWGQGGVSIACSVLFDMTTCIIFDVVIKTGLVNHMRIVVFIFLPISIRMGFEFYVWKSGF